jgi:endonuclease YncB( thermonuclease family)
MIKSRLAVAALLITGVSISGAQVASAGTTVTKVTDGDTITLSTGKKVRLLQIDTPELSQAECYGQEARNALVSLLNTPGQISLMPDPNLDQVDRYGRLLRYVFIGKININLKLVEIGAAAPYFYRGEKGRYSTQILKAAQSAKYKSLGLWKSCPGTKLSPTDAVTTIRTVVRTISSATSKGVKCDPNYVGCIPVSTSDLDCTDIKLLGLAPVKVIGIDVHRLDRDGDGIGCDK